MSPSWKQRSAKSCEFSAFPGEAARSSRPAASACSVRPSRASSRATLARCSVLRAAVERGELAGGLGRVDEPAGRLVEPGEGDPRGDRLRVERDGLLGGVRRLDRLAGGLGVAGQAPPGRGVARLRPGRFLPEGVEPGRESTGGLVGGDPTVEDLVEPLVLARRAARPRRAGLRPRRTAGARAGGRRAGAGGRASRGRAGRLPRRRRRPRPCSRNRRGPRPAAGASWRRGGAGRDPPPGGQGVVGPLQAVVELAEVLAILGRVGRERDGLPVERDRLVDQARLAIKVGDLRRGRGVVRPGVDQLPPDGGGGLLPLGLGLRDVAEEHLAPVADEVGVARARA